VDSNDFGYGHRSGLAAKADATLSQRCTPEMLSFRRRDPASSNVACFQAKHALGLDPWVETGARQEDASHQNMERRFDRVETVKALGMIQQVQVRQQMHGEIAAKRSVAVTAVTTDSGHLDRALIEHDIVALMSVGC
jgi:hypothetical protein